VSEPNDKSDTPKNEINGGKSGGKNNVKSSGKNKEGQQTNALRAAALAQQQRMRRLLRFLVSTAAAALLIGGTIFWLGTPPSSQHRPVSVTIPAGSDLIKIGSILQDKGIVRNAQVFALAARYEGNSAKLKAGRYTLFPDMRLPQIVQQLQLGPKLTVSGIRLTVPEGYTLRQIAHALETKGIAHEVDFLKLATDPVAIQQLQTDFPLPKKTLEGYLYPDTYRFAPNTPPQKVIVEMLTNFSARFARPNQAAIASSGHTLHELVTTASLIECEAKAPQDRPRIGGVIENRLRKKMRLEIDATVLYALGHHKDRVLFKDLTVDSPYNTYRHRGLPPGPIASPGLPSLEAALHPEQNDFFYYVARPDGTHIFTRTIQQHHAAIQQVRDERKLLQPAPAGTEVQPGG